MLARVALGSLMVVMFGVGCDDDEPASTEADWTLLGEEIPGGALLGGWPVGDELYLVGGQLDGSEGVVLRLGADGACVDRMAAPRLLWWIHGASVDVWYAVGEAGQIIRSEGGVRVDESVPTMATLYGVWDAGDRVYAVGGDVRDTMKGEVWVRESGTWRLLAGDLPGVLFKVWRSWVVGDGISYRIDGDSLREFPVPDGEKLLTVVGRDDEDVWAVGGRQLPVVLHWEGDAWAKVAFDPLCANIGLNGVWTAPGEPVWIAGFYGAVGRYDGESWACPQRSPTEEHLHVVVGHQGEVFAGGGNLFHPGEESRAAILRHGLGERTLTDVSACE